MIKNEMTDIKAKNRKILSLLLPTLSVGIVMILFNLLDAVSGFVLTKCETSLSLDSIIQDLLVLFIAQLIAVATVIFVFVPFFNVKHAETHPISNASSRTTLLLFFLALGTTFLSSLIFTSLFTALNWEPQTGYSEIILTAEHMDNSLNIVLFLVSMTIGAALFEEMVYRRLLIPLLENYQVVPSTAVIVSSIMFAMAHLDEDLVYGNIAGAIIHTVGVFLFAMVLGITYILTRNVLFPILIHAISNLFGSLSILFMLIGNESLLTIYSILMLVMLVIGLGVTIYLVCKCFYGSKTEITFVIWNKPELNGMSGLIGFMVVGLSLVYTPMAVEICLALLKINSDLSKMLSIVCLASILVMLVRLAGEKKHNLNEETVNKSSQV
jgi:membrane protease YdiL (CAAX protease family)